MAITEDKYVVVRRSRYDEPGTEAELMHGPVSKRDCEIWIQWRTSHSGGDSPWGYYVVKAKISW